MTGGRTPEELETLMEDAILLGDSEVAASLFEANGVLLTDGATTPARGRRAIARALEDCAGRDIYVAAPRRVVQVEGLAVLVGADVINVARRGRAGRWRLSISLMTSRQTSGQE
jgi:hypothetical protein